MKAQSPLLLCHSFKDRFAAARTLRDTESQLLSVGYTRAPQKEPRMLVPPKCTRAPHPARPPPCPEQKGICWFEKVKEPDGSSVKVAGWVFQIW